MTYYSHTKREMERLGPLQEGDLALYTGTVNPRQAGTLSPNTDSKNAYVYLWQDGQPQEVDVRFRQDQAKLDILEVPAGGEVYTFLRDRASGYIRQVSGPARPILLANLGAIPLRVDTFLGKFAVYAGTMLRLDEGAPQREPKQVLLTVDSRRERPLETAELWNGAAWQQLNLCEERADNGDRILTVLDGSAIVQCIVVSQTQEIRVLDAPEPDPDYAVFVTAPYGRRVTLQFSRTDYRDGQVVPRARTISSSLWGEPAVYDLQRLRESPTQKSVSQCTAELPGRPGGWRPEPALEEPEHQLSGSELRELLAVCEEADRLLPEPPEDFPE